MTAAEDPGGPPVVLSRDAFTSLPPAHRHQQHQLGHAANKPYVCSSAAHLCADGDYTDVKITTDASNAGRHNGRNGSQSCTRSTALSYHCAGGHSCNVVAERGLTFADRWPSCEAAGSDGPPGTCVPDFESDEQLLDCCRACRHRWCLHHRLQQQPGQPNTQYQQRQQRRRCYDRHQRQPLCRRRPGRSEQCDQRPWVEPGDGGDDADDDDGADDDGADDDGDRRSCASKTQQSAATATSRLRRRAASSRWSRPWNASRSLPLLLIALFTLRSPQDMALGSDDEERLVRDLFRDYNKLIRPVEVLNMTVEVEFGLSFIQLINVNEKNQIMTSNVWLQLKWSDYQLRWDEADYGGIPVLRLPPDKVWKPDIVLFNNADGNYEVRYKSNILIYPTGQIMWVPPAIYQSSCTIDVTYFPFDQQKCVMKFGSWTYNGDQVSLKLEQNNFWVDLSDYWKSGTWDIVEVPAFLNVHNNSKIGLPTETDISFYITIRRKTLFYTVNLILPTVLISFLCILVFYLPAEAGEKVTLGISILLSLVVFLLLVSKILPPTSLVLPLIAKYLLFTFLMNTMSILVTVIIINWNFRGPRTHRMPNWIRVLFLKYLPTILFMKRPNKTRLRWMMEMPGLGVHHHHFHPPCGGGGGGSGGSADKAANKAMSEFVELADVAAGPHHHHHQHHQPHLQQPLQQPRSHQHHPNCTQSRAAKADELPLPPPHHHHHHQQQQQGPIHGAGLPNNRRESDSTDVLYLSPEAYRATEAIEFIAEHLRCEDEYIQIREDWKYVAMVIDRLQLYIFFAVTAAGTMGILLDAPHIFQYVDQDKVIEMHKKRNP